MVEEGKVAVVVGASRGVGLAVCKKLKQEGYTVVGTTRSESAELAGAGVQAISGFDIASGDMSLLDQALLDTQIDCLVVAAGIQEPDTLDNVTPDIIRRQLEVNALGPVFVVQALRQRLRPGGQVCFVASKMGSIANVGVTGGDLLGYRMSKAALHIAGVTIAKDLATQQVAVSIVHPGVVFTDMLRTLREGRGVAPEKIRDNTISTEASADGIWKTMQGVTLENTGQFWDAAKGEQLEW